MVNDQLVKLHLFLYLAFFPPLVPAFTPPVSFSIQTSKRHHPNLMSLCASKTSYNNGTNESNISIADLNWQSMKLLRDVSDISKLCPETPTPSNPRLAKDGPYAEAVLKSWRQDVLEKERSNSSNIPMKETLGANLNYTRKSDNASLSGYVVTSSNTIQSKNDESTRSSVPAIILFHTGAGPQDVFLRWKADMLARDCNTWNENGCIVLIADILSDDIGWTWSDRNRYEKIRAELLNPTSSTDDKSNEYETHRTSKWKLRETISSAIDVLRSMKEVDDNRIAAMGWCLGGHSILELGRMNIKGVNTLVTFHGVFDGITDSEIEPDNNEGNVTEGSGHVLICNGKSDPFISEQDLEAGIKSFQKHGWNTKLLNFDEVRHGFTNSAQDCNPSDAFAFNENAATLSWVTANDLLQHQLKK